MARAQADDLLQSFRFRVFAADDGFLDPNAGFNNVTTPELSTEVAEYREGNRKYTLKQPGVPSVENVTMQRGLARTESTFANWFLARLFGGAPYRTELLINVYDQLATGEAVDDTPSRQIVCKEAFPNRWKPIGDLDATSSDININELECVCEEIVQETPAVAAIA